MSGNLHIINEDCVPIAHATLFRFVSASLNARLRCHPGCLARRTWHPRWAKVCRLTKRLDLNILNGGSVVAQKNRPYVVGILSFIPSKTSPTGGSVVA